ncbi:MAG: universal stress protein, partial [Dehalococcoidia bacterium]|nr:universal stress protein [Dehalococcoidia bacterium]
MYERILIPLDGSEQAEMALPYAITLAQAFGSEVDVVAVGGEEERKFERLIRIYLERVAAGLAEEAVRAKAAFLYGNPAEETVDYARKNSIGLIIMATHGRSGVARWVMGSVAGKIVRSSLTPVLLINAKLYRERKASEAKFSRILVPLDGSSLGAVALPYAEELARKMKAEIKLLHIPLPAYRLTGAGELDFSFPEQLMEDMRKAASDYLSQMSAEVKGKGIAVSAEIIEGVADEMIPDYAKEKGVDLVAMSTHGRGGLSRLVFGSVMDKVLHSLEIPILVIRGKD